jgi:replication factor A1
LKSQVVFIADVLGVVKGANDVSTVTGKQSKKEISKRDVQLVDQSGMVVNLTLWGSDVSRQTFYFKIYVLN